MGVALAVDAGGQIFMTDVWGHEVHRFDAGMRPVKRFGRLGLGTGQTFQPTDIAVDGERRIAVLDMGGKIDWFDEDGNLLGEIRPDSHDDVPRGIAAGPDGYLYAVTNGHHVLKYRL